MASQLSQIPIETGNTIEAWHVTQSIDAFTGAVAYDIDISGSLSLIGNLINGDASNLSTGLYSHAEGNTTIASGINSHAEGANSISLGNSSHAEGISTVSSGAYSHAEGYFTIARGVGSHAEGSSIITEGINIYNLAIGAGSHVEGQATTSSGNYSHAEGSGSITIGESSHAEGINTIASGSGQHVSGRYNTHGDSTSLFIVGNGITNSSRADAFKVTRSGSIIIPTQSAAPTWVGVEGELIPTAISGNNYLSVWTSGSWQHFGTPYKKLVIGITQPNATGPTSSIFENTLGGTPIWTRNSAGNYYYTLAGTFTTRLHMPPFSNGNGGSYTYIPLLSSGTLVGYYTIRRDNDNRLQLLCFDSVGNPTDLSDHIGNSQILFLPEIRIYS